MQLIEPPNDPPLEPKSIPKKRNLGKFTLPCSLDELKLDDVFCNSGSSVNVISFEMFKQLRIKEIKRNTC